MKKFFLLSLVSLCLILVLGFSGCSIFDELLGNKDYGAYTSITFKLDVTYKGLNSEGRRKLTLGSTVANDEFFVYPDDCNANSECDDSSIEHSYSFTATINTTTYSVTQEYINWDYYKFANNKTNYKLLCASYSASIVDYDYEAGKDDPGSPLIGGLDQLNLDFDQHCTGAKVTDCTISAQLTFTAANTARNASDPSDVYVVKLESLAQ